MRTRGISLIPLLFSAPMWGGVVPYDGPRLVEDDLDAPRDLAVAEINGDESLDIVACSETAGVVEYLYKVGSTWVGSTVSSLVATPFTVAVGDLDRDGDVDIVVGQYDDATGGDPEDAEVLWLRNPGPGAGAWTPFAIRYLTGWGVRKVVVADVDADGDPDVLVGAAIPDGNGQVLWMANPGDPEGTWVYHDISTDFTAPYGIAAGDIDSDSDVDVVTADLTDDKVVLYLNDGTPANGGWVEDEVDAALDGARSVAIADIDGDDELDIVAAGAIASTIVWYEGAGATWPRHTVVSSFGGAGKVGVADFDQDGDNDLYGRAYSDGDISWFDNFAGDGSSWLERSITLDLGGASAVEAADFDLDGDLDIAAASLPTDLVDWWRNETIHRRFYAPAALTMQSGGAEPRAVQIADLNGDGWPDVTYALWTGDAVRACLSYDPDNNLWWSNSIDASFDGALAVAVADLNRDGAPDVVSAAVDGDDVSWYENDGDILPGWTERAILSALDGAHRAVPFDVDLDGDLDLAVAGQTDDELGIAVNANGLGTDWDYNNLWWLDGPFDVRVGDLDRNGRTDIVASAYYGDRINAYLNHYPDPAVEDTVVVGIDGPRGLDLCDLDGDGDIDVAAVARLSDAIVWLENDDGSGTAWAGHDIGTGVFDDGAGLRCADLDGDGDADVAAAGQAGDSVFVWRNSGTGLSWDRYMMDQAVDNPWDLDAGDLDRDGDADLVVAAGGAVDSILWYRNVGGQFGAIGYDEAPTHLLDGERDAIVSFIVSHHGRSVDSDIELFVFFLDLFDGAGVPLASTQANALVDRIEVFRDDDDAVFEPGVDPLVTSILTLTLTGGRQTISITDGQAEARIVPGESQRFWLAMTAAAGAGGQSPNQIVAVFPTDELIADDRTYDIALAGEPAADVVTDPIYFGDLIFADAFESGDCTRWDYWTGY